MSLQYVIGPSGSGRSTYLFENVMKEADANRHKHFLVIVPEQFTMVTQRRLVSISGKKCILNVDVLSFERLAHRVFDELGSDDRCVLGDTGKMLLLKRAVSMHMDELKVLGRNMKKRGYLDHVKSLISEFEQYGIGAEDLILMQDIPDMPASFSDKMNDIYILYKEYMRLIREKYITSEMILELLCDVIDGSEIVRDSIIVFDGYTGFTPVQMSLMRKLLKLAGSIRISVTGDPDMAMTGKADMHQLFAMSRKMMNSLGRIAEEEKIEILEPVRLDGEGGRFTAKSALYHLERNIFRSSSAKYKDKSDEIRLLALSNPRREIRYVASEIHRLVRTEGLLYRDIAVVCPDLSGYRNNVAFVFEKTGIPVFVDERNEMLFHPLLEFIGAAFDIILYDFSMDGVIRLLRSGLCSVDTPATDRVENYLRACGLRGKKAYSHVFARMPRDYTPEEVAAINESISFVRERLVAFSDAMENAGTVKEYLTGLYTLIYDLQIEKQLDDHDLYVFVMELMDQMADLLGDDEMELSDFIDLFKCGLSEASIGKIPMTGDSVLFGDIERSRLSDIKVLFLIGAGDHSIPMKNASGGILSQSERLILSEADFELAPTDRERSFMQRFYLYLVLTKPSGRLYITYPSLDAAREAVGPSYLFGILRDMYDGLDIEMISDDDPLIWTETEWETRELLCRYLREYAAGSLEEEKENVLFSLCSYMTETGQKKYLDEAIESVFFKHSDIPVSQEVMDAVYGKLVRMSVSRLESYVSCAYAYYLKYLLRLSERKEHEFMVSDMGSLYHSALEKYSRLLKESGETWHSVSEELQSELLDKGIREAMSEFERAELFDEARERFVADNITRTLKRSIWALTGQVRAGKFEPKHFEVTLEEIEGAEALRMSLSNDRRLQLSGKIDRIDTCEKDDTVYVKIIDYKSGGKDISLSDMYYGMQIQLFVYMGAALAAEKKESPSKDVVPAGFFYYHIHDPFVDADIETDKSEIEDMVFKELSLSGRVNSDKDIPELMDEGIEKARDNGAAYRSVVIPFSIKKDGEQMATTRAFTTDVIDQLVSYATLLGKQTGEKIAGGCFDVNPVCDASGNSSCKYCAYHSICGFDNKIEGFAYNRLKALSDQEVLDKIVQR